MEEAVFGELKVSKWKSGVRLLFRQNTYGLPQSRLLCYHARKKFVLNAFCILYIHALHFHCEG